MVEECMEQVEFQSDEKGLTLILDVDVPFYLNVITDEGRLRQVITNLLSNSVKVNFLRIFPEISQKFHQISDSDAKKVHVERRNRTHAPRPRRNFVEISQR